MRIPLLLVLLFAAAGSPGAAQAPDSTVAAARRFLDGAERELAVKNVQLSRATWIAENFITHDTELLAADAEADFAEALKRLVRDARQFDGAALPAEERRRLLLLKLQLPAPAPPDSAQAAELARLAAGLEADYGRGQACDSGATGKHCRNLDELSRVLAHSRNPDSLTAAWVGWHAVGAPMRDRYARFVALSNAGAREMGFADAGAMWRAGYDMPPDAFVAVVDSLWAQVRPLYLQLHAYVRRKLVERYGTKLVSPNGMLPVPLLGNMWGQDWSNIADVVVPRGAAGNGVDITPVLASRHTTSTQMVRIGERFYTSLGFDSLPASFWERSLLSRPRDRDVVCHPSAEYVDDPADLRIKACFEPTEEDLKVVHHELGHDFYFRSYKGQPYLYQNGANDGFHEAIGDAIALSVTPRYLVQIGLLGAEPAPTGDTLQLLRQALDHVAFLPFGITIDKWRWEVFAGQVKPDEYTKRWWELRGSYGGVAPPVARSATDFDPGAKFHVPGNTPYMRYFLAQVLEFQFYRAMCHAAGQTGPLYRCSFYGSKDAGKKLAAMLQLGASRPWPDALEVLTGQRSMDATALLDYFQPLMVWLERQNKGVPVGWAP